MSVGSPHVTVDTVADLMTLVTMVSLIFLITGTMIVWGVPVQRGESVMASLPSHAGARHPAHAKAIRPRR